MPKGEDNKKRIDLSVVDVEDFLNSLGIQNLSHENNDFRFSCPYPAHSFGDKSPSAYMNKTTTAFICFSCGKTGNAITFLADTAKVSRGTARQWIQEKWAPEFVEIEQLEFYLRQMWAEARDIELHVEERLDEEVFVGRRVDWDAVRSAGPNAPGGLRYMIERGFSPEILTSFEVIFDTVSDRPAITVRDSEGKLVGFKGRAWNQMQQPKYMVLGDTERSVVARGEVYGFRPYDASQFVFALDRVQPRDGNIVVCEGELNVIAMHQMGFEETVGPSGSTLSETQVRLIVERADSITLLFDSDLPDDDDDDTEWQKAQTARIKLMNAISLFEPFLPTFVVADHYGDPAEIRDPDEIQKLLVEAQSSMVFKISSMIA